MINNLNIEHQSSYDNIHTTLLRKEESVTGLLFLLRELRNGKYKAEIYQCIIGDGCDGHITEYTRVLPYKTFRGSKGSVEMKILDLCGKWYQKTEREILEEFDITIH
ncbi:MAG: hypothetical protein AABX19_03350 [Nanoarchaeota archaeon]